MNCKQFVKKNGGRGRPGYDSYCVKCGTLYTDHPNELRDRYKHTGLNGLTAAMSVVSTGISESQRLLIPVHI